MAIAKDSSSVNAMGGTEMMKHGLVQRIPADLLNNFQIFVSRVEEELDPNKVRIYWCHDLPEDPATRHLANRGWERFHLIVFASNWQMQRYIEMYNIPWSRCIVMQNAIEPIQAHEKPNDGKLRLAYWSTPHRGLNILVPVFAKLCEMHDNIELDVYSSFNLYGWGERDEHFKELFQQCEEHPKINYYGAIPNDELRANLEKTHILAYPSIWKETSCMVLMEAMSAGMLCVHPNYGALYETAANWTNTYQWHEDINQHASILYQILDGVIQDYWDEGVQSRLASQASYANVFYSWNLRSMQWESLLRHMVTVDRSIPNQSLKSDQQFFEYRPGI